MRTGRAASAAGGVIPMPFCPTCRTEYRPGTTACADCHVPLVDRLPPEEEWVAVFTGTGLAPRAVPEVVVVATGTEADLQTLAARYTAAGFHPHLDKPRAWANAALSLPWSEITERTAEADLLRAPLPS